MKVLVLLEGVGTSVQAIVTMQEWPVLSEAMSLNEMWHRNFNVKASNFKGEKN
jgi:hypothetical protein